MYKLGIATVLALGCVVASATEPVAASGIYEWGYTKSNRATALATVTDATMISSNSAWTCVLRGDGSLYAWGSTSADRTNVPAGTNYVYMDAGWLHGACILSDGTIDEWGQPYTRDLATWESWRPAITTAIQVACGDDHTAALLSDGTIRVWGGRAVVTAYDGTITDAIAIESGWYHVLVLHSDGTVSTFGTGLGVSVSVPVGATDIVGIGCGIEQNYAWKADGTLYAWGRDTNGESTVPGGIGNVVQATGGNGHSIALIDDGTVTAWGLNNYGQTTVPTLDPVAMVSAGHYDSSVIFAATPPATNVYYVRTDGSDSNDGSANNSANAFLTVQHAVDTATAGDTIMVAAGTYNETVTTAVTGTSGNRITIDGQGVASIKQFIFYTGHEYITIKDMEITGLDNSTSVDWLIYIQKNADYAIIDGCVLDGALSPYVGGISWQGPSTLPFDADVASNVVITDTTITNIAGSTAVSMFGSNNLMQASEIADIVDSDAFRIWGQNNTISNVWAHGNTDGALENHIDMFQTFGDNGHGSTGIVIENCLITDCDGQLTQLSSDMIPEVSDWTFRNNVFARIALTASVVMNEVKWYNNTFYDCGVGDVISTSAHAFTGSAVTSGNIAVDNGYLVTTTTGNVTYNGTTYTNGQKFAGVSGVTTFIATGDAVVNIRILDGGDDCEVKNNIFIDCGSTGTNNGWYNFQSDQVTGLFPTGCSADYNLVAKNSFGPVDEDDLQRSVGDVGGWTSFGEWWEDNGINGGNPQFTNAAGDDFTIGSSASVAISAATDLSSTGLLSDRLGYSRPQGVSWDIGAYEYLADDPTVRRSPARAARTGALPFLP